MPRRRFAIITYDPDRIAKLDYQAEGLSATWIIVRALQGHDYPRERGIIRVTLMDQVPVSIAVASTPANGAVEDTAPSGTQSHRDPQTQ